MQLKKLTRDELRNIKGGLDPLPLGCFCYIIDGNGNPLDPDCFTIDNPGLYCAPGQEAGCC